MSRRDLDYLVIIALFLSGLYVTLSGLIADVFGFPQVLLHSTLGYISAGLAVVHLLLNWRRVVAYARWRLGRRPPRQPAQESGKGAREADERAPSRRRRQIITAGLSAAGGFVLGWLVPGRRRELPFDAEYVGQVYHEWSKPGAPQILGAVSDWGKRPEPYKRYPDAQRVGLPDPQGDGGLSVARAIDMRRSVRSYSGETLSVDKLSRLLHAAQGITAPGRGFRAAPSAGALYPIEIYSVLHDVDALEAGIYHYAVGEHALERIATGEYRAAVTQAGLFQGFLGQANVCFILSAIFQRTRWRYRERTYRYVMLEAGHVGQNLYLAATGMGLGACAVGAFLDGAFNDLLGLDGREEAVLYVVSVGTV